jgi:exodeoxyribonuclease V beta subunit
MAARAMSAPRVGRPDVLRRIPVDRSVVLEASAGTGKTFTLEHLVVEVLLTTETTLDGILVVTFTEKATQELRQRLRAKLESLLARADEGSVARGSHDVADGDAWVIDDTARGRIDGALRSFDAATVTTIHAFCQRVLRENAFFSGRMFEEEHVDGLDAFTRALPEALRRSVARDPERAPWLEAALRGGWSMDRIQGLLWRCVESRGELRPEVNPAELRQALAAFPVDAARRVETIDDMRAWGVHQATAKKVARECYKLADAVEHGRAGGLPGYALAAHGVEIAYLREKLTMLPASASRGGVTAAMCRAAFDLARATPTFSGGLAQMLLPPVRGELSRRKWEAGQYDFDDMLALVDEALRGTRGEALAKSMRDRWRYVFIDEFQDTDELQWAIFRRAFLAGSTSSVLCLVGDPKQSIYRFRGADVDTYVRACDEVTRGGGARVRLDQSYRATPGLVLATNAIFADDAKRTIFDGPLRYTPVTCGRPDRTLVDGAGREVSPVHAMRVRLGYDTLTSIGAWIASEVKVIVDPARPWRLDGRPLGHRDVFVLTRTSREGRLVGAALRDAGVPYTFYKQDGLFQTDEAEAVLALLAAIEEPADRSRRLAAWLTPFFGLSLTEVDRARDLPASHPMVARLHAWNTLAEDRDFDRLFEAIVHDSGFVRREIFFGQGERATTNYLHVFELLLEYAHGKPCSLGDLVQMLARLVDENERPLEMEGNVQRLESEEPAVQIMTIHKAKGLEAPIVFVAGGFTSAPNDEARVYHDEGRRFAWVGPIGDADVEKRAKAEERQEDERLMYVALTRAQGRLYLPDVVADREIRGPYRFVQRRITDLLAQRAPFVTSVDVPPFATTPATTNGPAGPWTPPAALLRAPNDEAAFDSYRRLGPFLTSYTRMRGDPPGARPSPRDELPDRDEEPSAGQLRGARASGVFLHELLERVPLDSFAGATFDVWRARADVASLFEQATLAHRIDRTQRPHAERLVWSALTTPVSLPGGARIAGITSASGIVREMEFVFPMSNGPRTWSPTDRPAGFVRGAIDLAFEHGGATYFVDWKSDSLASFDPEDLRRHVRDHYEMQVRLYTVAVVKLLGIDSPERYDRFGGLLYCFLRGMGEDDCGVWAARPTWDAVSTWERELRAPRERPAGVTA